MRRAFKNPIIRDVKQDTNGAIYPDTTNAIEYNDKLYMGSFSAEGIGCFALSSLE